MTVTSRLLRFRASVAEVSIVLMTAARRDVRLHCLISGLVMMAILDDYLQLRQSDHFIKALQHPVLGHLTRFELSN